MGSALGSSSEETAWSSRLIQLWADSRLFREPHVLERAVRPGHDGPVVGSVHDEERNPREAGVLLSFSQRFASHDDVVWLQVT